MTTKTSDLCDACADIQACELPFISFGKLRAFSGAIRTVRVADGIGGLRKLVNQPGHGDVLVIDAEGSRSQAVFGDVMAERAMRNGWAGVVVNGVIRDMAEINAMEIGVKALGTFPRRAALGDDGSTDQPVQFGGVEFAPGRRLVADEDGVIVLPPGLSEADISVEDTIAATAAYAAGSDTR